MDKKLLGGNVSVPKLSGSKVYKDATIASENIHALLCFAQNNGISWIPKSYGIDLTTNKHVLSYINGEALHDLPDWIWDECILVEMAKHLRDWHDATKGFIPISDKWGLQTDGSADVICHNDFAPYNWIFKDEQFVGLIDFDTCAPGSRLWDICYTAYRLVPLMPNDTGEEYYEYSQFDTHTMIHRLGLFLASYSNNTREYSFTHRDVIEALQERLLSLAVWSRNHGYASGNDELLQHAEMYSRHRKWLRDMMTI